MGCVSLGLGTQELAVIAHFLTAQLPQWDKQARIWWWWGSHTMWTHCMATWVKWGGVGAGAEVRPLFSGTGHPKTSRYHPFFNCPTAPMGWRGKDMVVVGQPHHVDTLHGHLGGNGVVWGLGCVTVLLGLGPRN